MNPIQTVDTSLNYLKVTIVKDLIYEGQLDSNQKMHGIGRMFDQQSGNLYEGQFEHGVYSGYGRMIFGPNGEGKEMFIGMWLNGLFHGDGVLNFRNGTI